MATQGRRREFEDQARQGISPLVCLQFQVSLMNNEKCFACDRRLGRNPHLIDTRDGQTAFVGSECFKLIKASGEFGYQPPLGGPRLWTIKPNQTQEKIDSLFSVSRKSPFTPASLPTPGTSSEAGTLSTGGK